MARTSPSPTPPEPSPPPYQRDALFRPDGPINPLFVDDTVRSLVRTLPHDPEEDAPARNRRMYATMSAISGKYPRDEIEMMYCAIRMFDTMIKGLERRQAKPCVAPMGPNTWDDIDLECYADSWADRVRACSIPPLGSEEPPPTAPLLPTTPLPTTPLLADAIPPAATEAPPDTPEPEPPPDPVWTPEMVAKANADLQTEDPGPPPVEGVEPDGSIVVPDNPTPEQESSMGARIIHNARDHWTDDIMSGEKPKIPRLRPGDRIP